MGLMVLCIIILCSFINTQGYLLPRHSSVNGALPQFREAIAAAAKVYEIGSTFRSLLSTNTGAMEIQRGLEADICEWVYMSHTCTK